MYGKVDGNGTEFLVCTISAGIQMIKGMAAMLVHTTKECNYYSIVIVHQHGGYDVTCKPRIIDNLMYEKIHSSS